MAMQYVPKKEPAGRRAEESRIVTLYERWGLAVYRRALGLLGDPDEALDVTQEAFISLFQRLARVENDAAAFGLLYQTATFQAIDRVRRQSRWSSCLAQPTLSAHAREAQEAHEKEARQVEAAQDLALLTRGESSRALKAALLHFVGGYTLEEVGEKLALSGRTVGRMLERLSERARKRGARLGGARTGRPPSS
jgi:RNA polymerase sigma-70 factor (ECF subfamily)